MNDRLSGHPTGGSDLNIQVIRALAVVLIFTCHILEAYGSFLAWWLNAGVQVFLFTSGFLFGGRTFRNWREWFGRRLARILPAYYLVILPVALLAAGPLRRQGVGRELLASLFCVQDFMNLRLPGCDHLWFITLIMACYLAVPPLQFLRDRFREPLGRAAVFFVGLPAAFYLLYKVFPFLNFNYAANLAAFAWGYYFASQAREPAAVDRLQWVQAALPVCAAALLAGRGLLELFSLTGRGLFQPLYFKLLLPWGKVALAAALFLGLYRRPAKARPGRAVSFIDHYAYEIYLTHHLFIFGPLALIRLTRSQTLDILVIALLTVAASVALRAACERLTGVFGRIQSRAPAASAAK